MSIGAFSLSLNVKDIQASKTFYEKIGFTVFGGNIEQLWLIMQNEDVTIGLFQGMFEGNLMTFNPGWDGNAQLVPDFKDIRVLKQDYLDKGIDVIDDGEANEHGPSSFTMTDPDGNVILIDQHV